MTSAATLPSRLALCASMGPVATSPMAKMFGSSVRQSGSVSDEALVVDLRRACSRGRGRRCSAAGRWPPAPGRSACATRLAVVLDLDVEAAVRPPPVSTIDSTFESTMISSSRSVDLLDHHVDQVEVGAHQQAREELDHRDLRAQALVDQAHLQADVAAADHEQARRHAGQLQRLGAATTPTARCPAGSRFRLEPVAMMACWKSTPLTSPPSTARARWAR